MLGFGASLLAGGPAEPGLGLGAAGGLWFCGAGGAGRALIHRSFTQTKHTTVTLPPDGAEPHRRGGAQLPSLSPLAVAVVSVESQLSCSAAASVGAAGAADPDADALETGAALLPGASAGASDSDGVLVHWRAFF